MLGVTYLVWHLVLGTYITVLTEFNIDKRRKKKKKVTME